MNLIRTSRASITNYVFEQVTVDKVMGMGPIMGAIGSIPHSIPSYIILCLSYVQFLLPTTLFHPTHYSARPIHNSAYPTLCSILRNIPPVLYTISPTQHSILSYIIFCLSCTLSWKLVLHFLPSCTSSRLSYFLSRLSTQRSFPHPIPPVPHAFDSCSVSPS